MARKQEIEKGNAVNLAGTIPAGHGLGPIRAGLLDEPRERRWIIGQVVSASTKVDHPADADDRPAPTMQFVELAGITDQTDMDQLSGMLTRVMSNVPGHRTLDEAGAETGAGKETA